MANTFWLIQVSIYINNVTMLYKAWSNAILQNELLKKNCLKKRVELQTIIQFWYKQVWKTYYSKIRSISNLKSPNTTTTQRVIIDYIFQL